MRFFVVVAELGLLQEEVKTVCLKVAGDFLPPLTEVFRFRITLEGEVRLQFPSDGWFRLDRQKVHDS